MQNPPVIPRAYLFDGGADVRVLGAGLSHWDGFDVGDPLWDVSSDGHAVVVKVPQRAEAVAELVTGVFRPNDVADTHYSLHSPRSEEHTSELQSRENLV